MTLSILADIFWFSNLGLVIVVATYTLGRQFWSEQRERREQE